MSQALLYYFVHSDRLSLSCKRNAFVRPHSGNNVSQAPQSSTHKLTSASQLPISFDLRLSKVNRLPSISIAINYEKITLTIEMERQTALRLTAFRYKKEGITEAQLQTYMTQVFGPRAAPIQVRHGVLKVIQVSTLIDPFAAIKSTLDLLADLGKQQYHTPSSSKKLITEKIPWALGRGWTLDDHDVIISVYVPNAETMAAIVNDPEFQELLSGDSEILQPTAKVTAGWDEVFVDNGQVVTMDRSNRLEESRETV